MENAQTNYFKLIFQKRFFVVLLLGFWSGLPLLLTGGTLKLWLAREGIDAKTIGFFSLVALPYSLKFLIAPFLDYFHQVPLGRRRFWLFISQIFLALLIWLLGQKSPALDLNLIAYLCIAIAITSSIQDIVIDAYKREYLPDEEIGLGSSINIYGYRLAMLLAGGIGVSFVDPSTLNWSWSDLYTLCAGLMALAAVITLLSLPEPTVIKVQQKGILSGYIQPFAEFLKRPSALIILLFVFTFKLGDAFSGSLLSKFYVDIGFTNLDIGLIAKTWGLASSLLGLFLGGLILVKYSIGNVLLWTGVLQALSTLAFALLDITGPSIAMFSFCVVFEDLSAGMGSAAFVAYMASLSNKQYTATQYAALASIAGLGRNLISAYAGIAKESLGWQGFFVFCFLIAFIGLGLLLFMRRTLVDAIPKHENAKI